MIWDFIRSLIHNALVHPVLPLLPRKLAKKIHEYLLDKNPSTSIDSEEVDKSTQKRLAIQKLSLIHI